MACDTYFDNDRLAVWAVGDVHGQVFEVIVVVSFLLPAGLIQVLLEIALLVKQAHAHQRKAQVARGFQVVSGQNSKAAGKDRKALGDAELG